ncbi:hypothetical protein D7Z54_02940 [Salibacterium salarium]|uniref:YtkA-like n=1 Tax=Salibacterium salarium TaxID=284579 RepID=A0A428N8Y8_9BACI|nr:hypothetical protein [Salibacterium salarium]RSL34811.1 hypothetical protein D7Z54_02940 [Salibacterium salarium]
MDHQLSSEESVPAQVHLMQKERSLDAGSAVTMTVRSSAHEKITPLDTDKITDGVYETSVEFPKDGVYYLEAITKASD